MARALPNWRSRVGVASLARSDPVSSGKDPGFALENVFPDGNEMTAAIEGSFILGDTPLSKRAAVFDSGGVSREHVQTCNYDANYKHRNDGVDGFPDETGDHPLTCSKRLIRRGINDIQTVLWEPFAALNGKLITYQQASIMYESHPNYNPTPINSDNTRLHNPSLVSLALFLALC